MLQNPVPKWADDVLQYWKSVSVHVDSQLFGTNISNRSCASLGREGMCVLSANDLKFHKYE